MAATIHERFGRLQERFDAESEAHLETIDLLIRLKMGVVTLDEIVVTPNSWKIVPKVVPAAAEHPRPEPHE